MYLKTPVIGTDCDYGPREALDGGKYGTLVPVGDVKALSEGMMEILKGEYRVADDSWMEQFSVEHGVPQLLMKMGVTDGKLE